MEFPPVPVGIGGESIAIPPPAAILLVMFTRIVLIAMLLSAGSQLASAGLIVSYGEDLNVPVERVFIMNLAEEQESTSYVRVCDSDDQASGFVVNANSSGLVPLLAVQRRFIAPQLSVGTVQLWNACLPRSPCLDDLLKPA